MSRQPYLTTIQIVFIASMVSADLACGVVMKHFLHPTGILHIVRIDMIIPIVLLLTTRRMVDKPGVALLYQLVWAIAAIFIMPSSGVLPGAVRFIPTLIQGLIYDSTFHLLSRYPRGRIYIAALIVAIVSPLVSFVIRLGLGMPLNTVTGMLLSVATATGFVIGLGATGLSDIVWQRIKDSPSVRRIIFSPSSREADK